MITRLSACWLIALTCCGVAHDVQLSAAPDGGPATEPDAAKPLDDRIEPAPGHNDADDQTGTPARPVTSTPVATPGLDAGRPAVVDDVPASGAFPRLSHRQWALAAQNLLQLAEAPDVSKFSGDPPTGTPFDNTGDRLEVGDGVWFNYQEVSESLAAAVARDPEHLARLVDTSHVTELADRSARLIEQLGRRAFRRALTQSEREAYVALFALAPPLFPDRDSFSAGAELFISALLQAPGFVYRSEASQGPDESGRIALSDLELAGRLSFALWDSLPDEALLMAAEAGMLHTSEQVAAHAMRMLASPMAAEKRLAFHRQLLELDRYDNVRRSDFPEDLGRSLRGEAEHFLRAVIVDEAGSFADLLRARFTFLDPTLAGLYGVEVAPGSGFTRVSFDEQPRAGFLTQPGFLASRAGETAPILRGVFINRRLLCAKLPPPPAFTLPEASGHTRRERINSITGEGTCGAGCHAGLINPAGFPFETFDDQGRERNDDRGYAIDAAASYMLDGDRVSYDGPIEWSERLATSQQAHECYVRHWLEFALGRAFGEADLPLVRRIAEASRAKGLSSDEILVAIVSSPSFLLRRPEAL